MFSVSPQELISCHVDEHIHFIFVSSLTQIKMPCPESLRFKGAFKKTQESARLVQFICGQTASLWEFGLRLPRLGQLRSPHPLLGFEDFVLSP
jgi:hypothetical protein